MGQALSELTRQDKEEKVWVQNLLSDIKVDLELHTLEKNITPKWVEWMIDPAIFEEYMNHCRRSLLLFGESVYGQLASQLHYVQWVLEEKVRPDKEKIEVFFHSLFAAALNPNLYLSI